MGWINRTALGLALVVVLIFPLAGYSVATPIPAQDIFFEASNTPEVSTFTFTVRHGPIVASNELTHTVSRAGQGWFVLVNLVETPGGPNQNDGLVVSGRAQHVAGPHGEGQGKEFKIDFTLNPNAMTLGPGRLAPLTLNPAHGTAGHTDQFQANLDFVLAQKGGAGQSERDITSYLVTATATHVVPEPGTLFLLGSGMLGLGVSVLRRRRRESRRQT
jgi:hypothetical protein